MEDTSWFQQRWWHRTIYRTGCLTAVFFLWFGCAFGLNLAEAFYLSAWIAWPGSLFLGVVAVFAWLMAVDEVVRICNYLAFGKWSSKVE